MGKNKTIHSGERTMILRVLHFFEEEKRKGLFVIPVDQVLKRTCAATGVSLSTITRIKREEKRILQATSPPPTSPSSSEQASTSLATSYPVVKLPTPGKKRRQPVHNKLDIDDFTICSLRNIINSFYTVRMEVPTLKKILAVAKEDLDFPGQKETLRKILTEKLGYAFKKCLRKRDLLIERPEIAAWRARYLRRLKENTDLGADKKPVTYIDETWIHSHYTVHKCWQNSLDKGIRKNDSPGQRWIIVHAGGENGFIEGAELMYKCKSKQGDYHDEMDTENFLKWLNEKLLPNLPPNGIVVMDNAPYHSKQINKPPSMTSRKEAMQNWLKEKNIDYDARMTKKELYYLILQNRPKEYEVDQLIRSNGHEVLRLPPYQCELNPIEYVWNLIKQRVAATNVNQSEKEIEKLTRQAIQSITVADWRKEVNHVDRLAKQYWEKERLDELEERQLIINVGDDSDSDSQDMNFSDSEMSGIEEIDIDEDFL